MNIIEFLRQFRFSDYAIFDFAITYIGIYLLAPLLSKIFLKIRVDIRKKNWLLLALPLSVLIHLLVGKITPMTRDVIDMHDHYILKILILILLIYGIRGVRIIKR